MNLPPEAGVIDSGPASSRTRRPPDEGVAIVHIETSAMRRSILAALALVALVAGPAKADPPSNDNVTGATVVSSFPATVEVDTSEATTGIYEEECNGIGLLVASVRPPAEGVWYQLDLPAEAERMRITYEELGAHLSLWVLQGRTPAGEPILARWDCVYPKDDSPIYLDYATMYLSAAASLTADLPSFSIEIELLEELEEPDLVPNDLPYRATKIDSLPYETEQDIRNANFDWDPQGCPEGAYVWYTYTPAASETIEISVSNPDGFDDATVATYALGDEVTTLGCDTGYEGASVTTPVLGGVPILIGIGRYGIVSLSVRVTEGAASSDDRADALALTLGSAVPFDTAGTTLEPDEPATCGSGGSVWFELPARARAAEVTFTDTVSVAAVAGGTVLACSDTGVLAIDDDSPATHLQLRSPLPETGTLVVDFSPPFGQQLTDQSPFPPGCGQMTDHAYLNSEVEVSQSVDPHDSDHLLVTWQQDRYEDRGGAQGIGASVSFDGGQTWTNTSIPGLSLCSGGLFERATDPWAAIDADGTAYVMSLGYNPGPDDVINLTNTVLLSRSEDGGLTWDDPIVVAASPGVLFHDKETLTADPNTPGLLYAVWDVYPTNTAFPVFARSEDGGRTWTPPVPLATPGSGAGDQIAVLDDGTLVEIASRGSMQSITSRDRGLTWSLPNEFADGGSSEGPPGVRGGAYIPSVSTDGQSVYVSWSDTYITHFARSEDAGATWSVAQVGGDYGSFPTRSTTAVAGTNDGDLAVITYIVESGRSWLVMATSSDGGLSWSEQTITATFDMDRAPYSLGRGYFLGDYFALTDVGDGVLAAFTAVPPGDDQGVSNVYSLRLSL